MHGHRYHPFYCEENIHHLCQDARFAGRRRHVLFISGPEKACVMWHQRAAKRPGAPMFWDYHVVLLVEDPWEVWDLDTTLGLPVPAAEYLLRSFHPGVPREFRTLFRRVDADAFLQAFASDRSHMRRRDGSWQRPPPPWPPPCPEGIAPNLLRFVDMRDPIAGEVLELTDLLARVGAG